MDDTIEDLEALYLSDSDYVTGDSWKSVLRIVNVSILPKFESGFDLPPKRKDFENHIPVVQCNLKALKCFMTKLKVSDLYKTKNKKIKSSVVVSLLILCGEHNTDNAWSSEETVKYSREIIVLLCEVLTCKDVCELLVGDRLFYDSEVQRLYKPVLVALRPKLLKETWKNYPGAVACYSWLLFQVNRKYLSDYIGMVVPTALLLTDDFISENSVLGIKCLSYIADNSTKTDLHWHADVMYSAVKQALVHKKSCVIKIAVPCLISLIDKIERNYTKHDCITEWCKYDEALALILENLELWQKIDIRESFMETLPAFLESMPLTVVNWSHRLLPLFASCMETAEHGNPHFLCHTVLALKVYLKKAWPRIDQNCKMMLRILLRFLLDVTDMMCISTDKKLSRSECNVYNEVVKEAEECLLIIVNCSLEQVKVLCPGIKDQTLFNKQFREIIQRVFITL